MVAYFETQCVISSCDGMRHILPLMEFFLVELALNFAIARKLTSSKFKLILIRQSIC